MNTILRIFKHDVKGICRNMFALIIPLEKYEYNIYKLNIKYKKLNYYKI